MFSENQRTGGKVRAIDQSAKQGSGLKRPLPCLRLTGMPRANAKIPLPPLDGSAGPPDKLWRDYFDKHQPPSSAIAELVLQLQADKEIRPRHRGN